MSIYDLSSSYNVFIIRYLVFVPDLIQNNLCLITLLNANNIQIRKYKYLNMSDLEFDFFGLMCDMYVCSCVYVDKLVHDYCI